MTTKNPYGLTDEQIENLDKLATYLENLPADYEHFEMRDYIRSCKHWEPSVIHYVLNNGGLHENCGTVGCALGHGPAAGVLAKLGTDVKVSECGNKVMDWQTYATRFVPAPDDDNQAFSQLWRFLFGPGWAESDNTHRGAAARVRFVLAGRRFDPFFSDMIPAKRKLAMEEYQQYIK